MNVYILLMVILAVSPAFAQHQPKKKEIDAWDKDITDVNKGLDLTFGDIMVPPKNPVGTMRNTIGFEGSLWTSPISYVLDKDLEMNAKGVILRAFEQFRLKSCIDFKPKDPDDENYISVQKLPGCWSYIGRAFAGEQVISIGRYCDGISTVEHEFLHALGFYHEQSRHDRDDHVDIIYANIQEGKERNFRKLSEEDSHTMGTPYDYHSAMHYGGYAFSNGNGSTIITKDPQFQEVIGQRLEFSPNDILKLNRLYNCNSSITLMMTCSVSDEAMCGMSLCSMTKQGGWERVAYASGGPHSDHTNLPSTRPEGANFTTAAPELGHFLHASTISGQEGDSAWLKTKRMSPKRECHVQCLQFYYYHSGNQSDELNIWIREFQDETDSTGHLRLMGQITGSPTSHWQLQHVPLNATKPFQVEFEVLKGPGSSSGGFSIDDINLSENECPHLTWQMNDFEHLLTTNPYRTHFYSPRQYSSAGYAYQIVARLNRYYFGLYVRLVSGDYDDQLQWPCPLRQVTFLSVDQNPSIQLQMSKQRSFVSDPTETDYEGHLFWGKPNVNGSSFFDENGEIAFANTMYGWSYFESLDDMKSRDFLKGGSAAFLFTFSDITPLVNGSSLPCPKLPPVKITHSHNHNHDLCASRPLTTTLPPTPTTTAATRPPTPTTTAATRPPTTTTRPPPSTTECDSIFCLSPGMASSPVLILLTVVMFLSL